MTNQPNILFIHTDEQRADTLGCYGNKLVETDNIDALADAGIAFEDAHCTHPLCMPSRGSLLTGRYPNAHGIWRNGTPLPDDERTIAEALGATGYTTGLIGKAHFTPYGGDPKRHPESVQVDAVGEEACWEYWREFERPYYGFDHVELSLAHSQHSVDGGHFGLWLRENHPDAIERFFQDAALSPTDPAFNSWRSAVPLDAHPSTWVAERMVEFIDRHTGTDDPFFAWVGIPDPHFPYDPPELYAGQTDPDEVSLPVDWRGESWDDPPALVRHHMGEQYPQPWGEISEETAREITAHYYDMVALVDDSVGRILDALDERGIADETVVVFTSDHGDWLGDHGLWQKGAVPHPWRDPNPVGDAVAGRERSRAARHVGRQPDRPGPDAARRGGRRHAIRGSGHVTAPSTVGRTRSHPRVRTRPTPPRSRWSGHLQPRRDVRQECHHRPVSTLTLFWT